MVLITQRRQATPGTERRKPGSHKPLITYNMTVPDINNEFSLSHLYIYVNTPSGNDTNLTDGTYFIEDG